MMKLFLLLVLPALSSASSLDIVNGTEQINVSILDPDLGERVPEINANDSITADEALLLPPVELRNRQRLRTSFKFESPSLEWQTWRGSLPNGSVSIYNHYTYRYDYVCKYRCEAGFYNPQMGPYCRFPFATRVYRCATFEVLVNRDNFEFLEWMSGSYGSVPQNSIGTCSGGDKYVGMNKYGLGKVDTTHGAFYLPWKGKEYWYRSWYQVLTINKGVMSEVISDVKYKTDKMKIFHYPPETMRISTITNHACSSVVKTVTLSKTDQVERRWDRGFAHTLGVTSSLTTKIPIIGVETSISFSAERTLEFSQGTSLTEENSHSVSVQFNVPSNHVCRARMVGYRNKADIPFTARLTRTYQNGKTQWTTITGKYYGVQIGEVHVMVDRCRPVPDASPCR
ncbi:natterin-3-like [Thunnus thynnus]|uniref:natterin-3-like n=1 Tax=Thunnus thynnus TaxID=8237 RepID=UPI003527AEB4